MVFFLGNAVALASFVGRTEVEIIQVYGFSVEKIATKQRHHFRAAAAVVPFDDDPDGQGRDQGRD
jgi:hypothetical protein